MKRKVLFAFVSLMLLFAFVFVLTSCGPTDNKYTITIDNQAEGVTISGITSGNQYDFDSQIALTATNIPFDCISRWNICCC